MVGKRREKTVFPCFNPDTRIILLLNAHFLTLELQCDDDCYCWVSRDPSSCPDCDLTKARHLVELLQSEHFQGALIGSGKSEIFFQ